MLLGRRHMFRELNTALDTVHPHGVLLVFVNLAEYLHQLGLRNLGHKLDHLNQKDTGLFTDLGCLVRHYFVEKLQ